MDECREIIGLKLSPASIKAIDSIKHNQRYSQWLAPAFAVGIFNNIFMKSSLRTSTYNITQTDWVLYMKAMKSLPNGAQRYLKQVANYEIVSNQMDNNYKQVLFWKGIKNGCNLP